MTAPNLSPAEEATVARFEAAPAAPESYVSAADAGFDPELPHRPRTYGSYNCTLCGEHVNHRIHS